MTRRLAVLGVALLALTGCPRPAPAPSTPTPPPVPVRTPAPKSTPPPYVLERRIDVKKLLGGLDMKYEVEVLRDPVSAATATEDNSDPASYRAELVFKVKIPKPHKDLAAISKLNSHLPVLLPSLAMMIEAAKVSPVFNDLYNLKCDELKKFGLDRVDRLPTRHNFYDCETLLEMQHPETKRRAIFILSDMDVDTDGSDVDRVPVEGASSTFQPFTSYRWARKTDKESPFIAPREASIKELEAELAGDPPAARRTQIQSAIRDSKTEISDLQKYSFLIGSADPFVVLPGSMIGANRSGPFSVSVGDYCVVIHEGVLYPTIVGDVGPRARMGEASLRLCKQISDTATGGNRPVDDLKATYLVFPGSADKPFAVPDLDKWRTKCAKLLEEVGGYQGELFAWEDITKPKLPPATPSPATPAAPQATPTPAQAAPTSAKPATPPAPSSPKPTATPPGH
jgi:hypothetical protein